MLLGRLKYTSILHAQNIIMSGISILQLAVQPSNDSTWFADNDVCSLDEITTLQEACMQHRLFNIIGTAYSAAVGSIADVVEGINRCKWIQQLNTSETSRILQHQNC